MKPTDRELEIVALVAEGLSNREIGERVYLSEYTIKTHLQRINKKVGTDCRTRLVVEALRNGWIDWP